MTWVLTHSDERLGRRLVLLALADHAADDGTGAWPSVATIAGKARLSRSQTQRCLRELEDAGAIRAVGESAYGTTIYDLNMGAANCGGGAANPTAGGPHLRAGGAASTQEIASDLRPEPSRTINEPSGKATSVRAGSGPRVPAVIDRVRVTDDEATLAQEVLGRWNRAAGQQLRSRDWTAKIIMRIREHPELDADGHETVIVAALAHPWWRGPATPAVVYGNGAQFERSMQQVRDIYEQASAGAMDAAMDEIRRQRQEGEAA